MGRRGDQIITRPSNVEEAILLELVPAGATLVRHANWAISLSEEPASFEIVLYSDPVTRVAVVHVHWHDWHENKFTVWEAAKVTTAGDYSESFVVDLRDPKSLGDAKQFIAQRFREQQCQAP